MIHSIKKKKRDGQEPGSTKIINSTRKSLGPHCHRLWEVKVPFGVRKGLGLDQWQWEQGKETTASGKQWYKGLQSSRRKRREAGIIEQKVSNIFWFVLVSLALMGLYSSCRRDIDTVTSSIDFVGVDPFVSTSKLRCSSKTLFLLCNET